MLASKALGEYWNKECRDAEITGIQYDSRQVQPGDMFVCIPGFETDGHRFAKMAEQNGAALIVAEREIDVNVPVCYVNDSRKAIAWAACEFYDHPSSKFCLIGVTGTNGKTTTTYLIKSILETAGKCVGIIGTNQNIIGDKVLVTQSTTPTTPNALELQQLFSEMAEGGAEYVVMEVSSHALALDRVFGCDFEVGIFTNLTQDHLDFHKTMEAYLEAKAKLFEVSKKGIINTDDPAGRIILENCNECDVLSVGLEEGAQLRAYDIDISARGTKFKVDYEGKIYDMQISIPGKFSVYNALSAIGAALKVGIDMDSVSEGLKTAKGVLGRVEVIPTDTPYTVIIDYAHTPDGLENIISAVKEFAKGRVITMFGCGGDRDTAKRSIMGEISGRLSDYSIITSDNPRTEDPVEIVTAIEEGIKPTGGEYTVIVDRREAISYALKNAKKDDIIILAGKGQETYQIIGKEKYDFDERVVVYKALREMNK